MERYMFMVFKDISKKNVMRSSRIGGREGTLIEVGAALSGTLHTANIGIEKVICNILANPNIRHLISEGRSLKGIRPGMRSGHS